MGVSLKRLEKDFVFNFLLKNKVGIEFKSKSNTSSGIITEMNTRELKIELEPSEKEIFNVPDILNAFFYFQNNYHTFKTHIIKMRSNTIIVENPEVIVKSLDRKYDRIAINGNIQVKIHTHGELHELNYPKTSMSYYPDTPPISADFSELKIETLLKRFKEKMNVLVYYNKIVMLRNIKPKTFFEKALIDKGKAVIFLNTRADFPTRRIYDSIDNLTKQDYIDFEVKENNTDLQAINKVISSHLITISRANIFSYAIIPVLYKDYVVALIYLVNDHDRGIKIDEKIINYTVQFSKIMTYTLMMNNYFKEEEGDPVEINLPIADLSPGGLGIVINDGTENEKIEQIFPQGKNFKLSFKIDDREIFVSSKLVRKIKQHDKYILGFIFLDIKPEDFAFLEKHLYNKKD